ncbi:EAL domain-containing protein [Oxalobacteraceae sp. CFBP 8755]|nr:EAL domain-containing protein [Oxalobacteraceae sp. CFBP 8755]
MNQVLQVVSGRRRRWRLRAAIYVPVLVTLCLGMLVTAMLFVAIRSFEQERRQVAFERQANERIGGIRRGLDSAVEAVASLNRVFNAMQPITRMQFDTFATPMLAHYPYVRMAGYQRMVADADRTQFETARLAIQPGFRIRVFADGRMMPAPRRPYYRVVDYMMPMAENARVFGLDAQSRPEQTVAVERSCTTRAAAMTDQFDVIENRRTVPGFMIFMPVFRSAAVSGRGATGCALADGFTAVGFLSETLIAHALASSGVPDQHEFDVRVSTRRLPDPPRHVFGARGAPVAASLFGAMPRRVAASFPVAGMQWTIEVHAMQGVTWQEGLGSLLMLVTGSAITILAAAYIAILTKRNGKVFRLVKDRTAALKQANRSHQLLRQAIDACFNSIVILRAEAPGYAIEYVNPAFEKITGYTAAEVLGRDSAMLWGADPDAHADADMGVRDIVAMLDQQREGIAVLRACRKDGSTLWTEVNIAPVKDAAGTITHFVVVHSDLTEKRRYESELEYQATHDALTGLVNDKVVADRLAQEMASAARHKKSVWVVLVDLDRFKFVNDSVGHLVGNQCLQQIATRLANVIRPEDIVARLRGDEFMLVLTERGDGRLGSPVLDRIMEAIALPVMVETQEFFLTGSLGVACYPQDSMHPEQLIEFADLAMYRAKQSGRDNYQFYLPELNEQAQKRLGLERALRSALERGEFELLYEPQLDLRTGRIAGVEVLLRWRHPEFGLLQPHQFMEVAEDTGLIVPVGAWAMQRACAEVRAWQLQGAPDLRLALNLSGPQLSEPDLLTRVAQVLRDTGLPAGSLELELNEQMFMHQESCAVDVLARLRTMGVSIAMDGFGTGYSSLARLKDLPLDTLKIDRSFVRTISHQGNDAAIPNAIISLAHNLGMRVIAEGVDTEVQCEFLASNMCDDIQGRVFSAPLTCAAFNDALMANQALPAYLLRMHRRQPTLLLVDDEPNILAALKRQLRGTGLRILTAPGGREGLALLAQEPVDVIVSDQRMPGMTGVEFLRAVKTSHPDTVRIVLSGFTELQSVTDAVNEGAIYKFLTKPWDDAQLRNHIQEAVRHKEMGEENRRLDLELRTAYSGLALANRQLTDALLQQQEQIDRTGVSLDIVREALQKVSLPIIGLDEEQIVAFANLAAQALYGQHGMLLGEPASRFMPQLLAALDQDGQDGPLHGDGLEVHGHRFVISSHSMGNGTRSRGRLIIFNPVPVADHYKESA